VIFLLKRMRIKAHRLMIHLFQLQKWKDPAKLLGLFWLIFILNYKIEFEFVMIKTGNILLIATK